MSIAGVSAAQEVSDRTPAFELAAGVRSRLCGARRAAVGSLMKSAPRRPQAVLARIAAKGNAFLFDEVPLDGANPLASFGSGCVR